MARYEETENKTCCVGFSKFILLATNLCFLAIGGLTIYSGLWLSKSGWLNVFEDEYGWLRNATMWFIVGFGIVVTLIALAGCCGAMSSGRNLLKCYNIFIIISIIIFILLAASSFFMMDIAGNWENKPYPAETKEISIGNDFNKVYCFSESAYYCNNVPATSTIKLFFGESVENQLKKYITSTATVNDLCHKKNILVNRNFTDVCDLCKVTEPYAPYKGVYTWINDQCSPTPKSAAWCISAFKSNDPTPWNAYSGAPYEQCRTSFLLNWEHASKWFGIATSICTGYVILLLIFSCKIIRSRRTYEGSDQEKAPLVGRY